MGSSLKAARLMQDAINAANQVAHDIQTQPRLSRSAIISRTSYLGQHLLTQARKAGFDCKCSKRGRSREEAGRCVCKPKRPPKRKPRK